MVKRPKRQTWSHSAANAQTKPPHQVANFNAREDGDNIDGDGNDSDGDADNGNDINADGIQHIDAAAAYFILCTQKNSGDGCNGDLKNDDADDALCNGNDNDGYKQ